MDTVRSADGTSIAFDRTGSGPALVMVVGAFCDRHTTNSIAALLAEHRTVYEYDRRGRGDSSDTAPYAPDREVDDLAAVAAAATIESGRTPDVFGHSSGAVLALDAAARGVPMHRLVAYEPPYIVDTSRPRPGTDLADRLTKLAAAGDRAEAARLFLTEAVDSPPQMVAMIENSPNWPAMLSFAPTLSYDMALCGDMEVPAERFARISVPTLVLGGANSPEWFHRTVAAVAAAIPNAQHRFLDGQDHGAADDVLAPVLADFYG